ncbi:MAG: 2-succinylbenzoate--CoA ligase [Cyanobacteria bacterium J06621_12]
MNNELLNYLKLSAERDWLEYYSDNWARNQNVDASKCLSRSLFQLTQAKLAQISAVVAKPEQLKTIFIVEQNPIQFIASFFASVIAEVNLFLCDPGWKRKEWQQVLSLVKPDLILGDSPATDLIGKLESTVPDPPNVITKAELPDRSLIMIPTGGTSGKIKFAIHSWQTLAASVEGFRIFFACEQINSFCTLPLYHVSGLMQLMRSFLTQGKLIICPYKSIATQPIEINKSAYFISLIPTQLKFLLVNLSDWLSQFRTILVGGAPASRSLLDTAKEYNLAIAPIYGTTETASGVVALKPQDFLAGNYSNGKVMPHAQISIKDSRIAATGNRTTIGLIEIKGRSLYLGYYPLLSPPVSSLLTDDLGYFNHQGYLQIVGRDSQKIITGGENVFPIELEEVIYSTKLVQDVCIIGIPDPKWGQAVTAIYVPTAANNLDLIKQQMRSQLAKYKQPKNWLKVDYIPRNNRGKVNYQELQAIALQLLDKNLS